MRCVLCDRLLEPAPTKDGWMGLGFGKGIHDRCLEHIWTAYMEQPATMDLHAHAEQLESDVARLTAELEAEREKNRWIPVDLRKPDERGYPCTFKDSKGAQYKGYWNCGFFAELENASPFAVADVVVWRPGHSAPNENEE